MRRAARNTLSLLAGILFSASLASSAQATSFVENHYWVSGEATVGFTDDQFRCGSDDPAFELSVDPFAEFSSSSQRTLATADAIVAGDIFDSNPDLIFAGSLAEVSISTLKGDPLQASAKAEAHQENVFQVDMPSFFDFSWSLETMYSGLGKKVRWDVEQIVRLLDGDGNVIIESIIKDVVDDQTYELAGVLEPGEYTLSLWSSAHVSGRAQRKSEVFVSAQGIFSGSVVPVPEPGTALLLGLGLVLVGAHRRGARRAAV